jgi:hypothetical protein
MEQQKMNIDLEQLPTIVCDECESEEWMEVSTVKKVSAFISPNGQEGVVPIPELVCAYCGKKLQEVLQESSKKESQLIN